MSILKTYWLKTISFLILFSFCIVDVAFGAGFGIFVQGASALGQADAVVAHSDGPSSVFFNPALINDLPGTQAELGTTMVLPKREFESDATGSTTKSIDNYYFPSTFYITHQYSDRIGLGFGVFNPFGLGTEWPADWEGRSIATKSTITTFDFRPVISVKIHYLSVYQKI